VDNARALAGALAARGVTVATGGTDNHLVLVDVRSFGLTGRQAESALREARLTANRNTVPYDPNGSWYTSGVRLGTPAVTTLGMGPAEMEEVAAMVAEVLSATTPQTQSSGPGAGQPSRARYRLDPEVAGRVGARVEELLGRFPLYPGIEL
jgi:glycine hydroxymethyltransferase